MTRKLTSTHIADAFSNLSHFDQVVINHEAETLERAIKDRSISKYPREKVTFGRQEALELLSKIGIWMERQEK